MTVHPEAFFLEGAGDGTLQQRIKRLVVDGILSGRFQPGERMPSSRALATHLGVSRITVTLAYTDLVADDYLASRGRSGYFVSDTAPAAQSGAPAPPPAESRLNWARLLSHRPEGLRAIPRPEDWRRFPYPFIYGQTDPALFDLANWRQCALQALGHKEFGALTADQYDRDDPLLIDYTRRNILTRRGISADPETILITMGAQNALWLASQLLLSQRRTAVVENPGHPGLAEILAQTRCHTVAVDVDDSGLPPGALPPGADVVFTTVSHQCPTNVTMPNGRRRDLLRMAAARGFVIVEDDYEFELTFERMPSRSLKSMDEDGTVIHVGSFSKSLFPGLRLGYLVAPRPFVEAARALRATVLRHPPGHIQRTTAFFLSLGHYDAQIARMRKAFASRRQAMRDAIAANGLSYASGDSHGGSSFWMKAPEGTDTAALARALYPRGVVIEPGEGFFAAPGAPRNHYRLAYSSIPASRIPAGIAILREEIARLA